jgi:hypothetical protein
VRDAAAAEQSLSAGGLANTSCNLPTGRPFQRKLKTTPEIVPAASRPDPIPEVLPIKPATPQRRRPSFLHPPPLTPLRCVRGSDGLGAACLSSLRGMPGNSGVARRACDLARAVNHTGADRMPKAKPINMAGQAERFPRRQSSEQTHNVVSGRWSVVSGAQATDRGPPPRTKGIRRRS